MFPLKSDIHQGCNLTLACLWILCMVYERSKREKVSENMNHFPLDRKNKTKQPWGNMPHVSP